MVSCVTTGDVGRHLACLQTGGPYIRCVPIDCAEVGGVDAIENVSPDLAAKHALMNILPEDPQLELTGTMLITNAPTVVEYTTHPLNAQSLSCKCLTMCLASRQLLS